MINRLRTVLGFAPVPPGDALPPVGRFEILGHRCFGSVTDRFHPWWLPMCIAVESASRDLLLVIESRREKLGERYDFTFDLDSIGATEEDLLKERIWLFAENGYGHRVRIAMDGASQLTLIRRYLGEPRELLFDLDFSLAGNAKSYMQGGWSRPEATFCWTDGIQAKIDVPSVISRDGRYELTLTCHPLLALPHLASQDVTVTLNGYQKKAAFDAKTLGFSSFIYERYSLSDSLTAEITLDLPNAKQPTRIKKDSRDTRLLALAFKQITFARLLPAKDGA